MNNAHRDYRDAKKAAALTALRDGLERQSKCRDDTARVAVLLAGITTAILLALEADTDPRRCQNEGSGAVGLQGECLYCGADAGEACKVQR